MKIIILGANSTISKSLIHQYSCLENVELVLLTTNEHKLNSFINDNNIQKNKISIINDYTKELPPNCNLLINCIGVGTPKELNGDYTKWFTILENFDNYCIKYLLKNIDTTYVSFSSGVVYGNDFTKVINNNSKNLVDVNNMGLNNFYSIAKMYSEAKHRAYNSLKIIDLRLFSYFTRFCNLNDGYLLSDILKALIANTILETSSVDIVRDYVSPVDLSKIILDCSRLPNNCAIDVCSKKPLKKFQLLDYLSNEYGLQYKINDSIKHQNSSGQKNIYFSNRDINLDILKKNVATTSLDAIKQELKAYFKW